MKLKAAFVFLALLLAVSCGAKPQVGGFLKIEIPGYPDALVSVDDEKPVRFSELEQPLDLIAIPHKISITWPHSGQTTVGYANVEYGKTVVYLPELPKKESVEVSSSVPGMVFLGSKELGHSSKVGRIDLYAGQNTFEIKLDGFGFAWTTKAMVEQGKKIVLEPGTDDTHGALYIKSDSPGVEFVIEGSRQSQRLSIGSSFTPQMVPGKVVISEKGTPGVKHHVSIKAGKVTRVNFITAYNKKNDKKTAIESFGKTALLIGWSSQSTEIDLTGKTVLTDYELDKLTPFRPGTAGSQDVFKYLSCIDEESYGFAEFMGPLPEKIAIARISGKPKQKQLIAMMEVQNWLPQSPDGKWTVSAGMVYGPGSFKFEVKDFEPGSWDLKNFTVLVTKVDVASKSFEVREMPLSKMNPMVLGMQTYEPIGQKDLEWVKAYAFYDKRKLPMAVVTTPKWMAVFERGMSSSIDSPIFELKHRIQMKATSCSLAGSRYLICSKTGNVFDGTFIVDTENGNVYDNLSNPAVTNDGMIACNYESEANAGIVYRISGKKLVPVWAGIY